MTRTARAAFPRAIIKDRSQSRSGLKKEMKKGGAGGHNWGKLGEVNNEDELEYGRYDSEGETEISSSFGSTISDGNYPFALFFGLLLTQAYSPSSLSTYSEETLKLRSQREGYRSCKATQETRFRCWRLVSYLLINLTTPSRLFPTSPRPPFRSDPSFSSHSNLT